MSNLYIPDFFQIPRKKKMFFEEIVNAIEAALTGWVESDDDSKVFFGELVESGGDCFSQFCLICICSGDAGGCCRGHGRSGSAAHLCPPAGRRPGLAHVLQKVKTA